MATSRSRFFKSFKLNDKSKAKECIGIPKKLLYPCWGILHFLRCWLISSNAAKWGSDHVPYYNFWPRRWKRKDGKKIVPGSFWKSGSIPLPFISLWCGVTYFPTVITTPDPSSSSNTDWIRPCLKHCTLKCQEEFVWEKNHCKYNKSVIDIYTIFLYYLPFSKRSRREKKPVYRSR